MYVLCIERVRKRCTIYVRLITSIQDFERSPELSVEAYESRALNKVSDISTAKCALCEVRSLLLPSWLKEMLMIVSASIPFLPPSRRHPNTSKNAIGFLIQHFRAPFLSVYPFIFSGTEGNSSLSRR